MPTDYPDRKLMICNSCEARISKTAATCPHCGHVYYSTFWRQLRYYAPDSNWFFWTCFVIGLIYYFGTH